MANPDLNVRHPLTGVSAGGNIRALLTGKRSPSGHIFT
jgi:hypothetical protein